MTGSIVVFGFSILDYLVLLPVAVIEVIEVSSMLWFAITDEPTDQTRNGKLTNLLVGTQEQITANLIELKQAGMTMPLIWPPFAGVSVSKTLEDLNQLVEEIMPKVNAA